jgi:hypothetical protein
MVAFHVSYNTICPNKCLQAMFALYMGKIHNLQNNQTYKCPCGKEYKYRYYLACHKKACIKTIGSIPLERLEGAARLLFIVLKIVTGFHRCLSDT